MGMVKDIINGTVNNATENKTTFDVAKWAEQKNERRQWAYQKQDEMAVEISQNPEMYKLYLDVQSKFPNYSVGNALLVAAQNPKVTQLKDAESWKKENINFSGKPTPIIILEPSNVYEKEDGTEVQGYDAKNVYDISDMRVKRRLNTIPYTHENLMKAILSMSPVQVEIAQSIYNGKKVSFNLEKRTIEVLETADVKEILIGLIREIASVHSMTFENTELNKFKNESVAYMVCKRYGVPLASFNFNKIPEELKNMDAQEIKRELSKGAECLSILTEGMDNEMGVQQQIIKSSRTYER
ncbi:MAG: hypothetical protein ACLR4X_00060 [Clostridia bacterium]|jgi:hypothetical protein